MTGAVNDFGESDSDQGMWMRGADRSEREAMVGAKHDVHIYIL